MRLTRLSIGALTFLLLIAFPVNAAPTLHTGGQTSYDLSVSISFIQSCAPILSSTSNAGIVCPMIAIVSPGSNNGTLAWTVTGLNATTATLNVMRNITTSTGDIVTPNTQRSGGFNESINLATRIVTVLPFIEPELDQALQMAQTSIATASPTSPTWSTTITAVNDAMMRQPVRTMWWVNGPLKANDTVPVLLFPTNVTGSTNLDLGGSIGSRSAWTLAFPSSRSLLPPDPMASMTPAIPIANSFKFALTFNYDQTSDLLLTANADIHLGFGEQVLIPPAPCNSSTTTSPALTVCPDTPIPIMREFGIDLQACLKLTSTTLDLSQRLTQSNHSDSNTGSNSAGVSGTDSGFGQGAQSGGDPGLGSNSGSNSGNGGGYNPGSDSTTTGAVQPASNPAQSKSDTQSGGLIPWMYGILGIIAAAIVTSAVWIARSRTKKATSRVATLQPD